MQTSQARLQVQGLGAQPLQALAGLARLAVMGGQGRLALLEFDSRGFMRIGGGNQIFLEIIQLGLVMGQAGTGALGLAGVALGE